MRILWRTNGDRFLLFSVQSHALLDLYTLTHSQINTDNKAETDLGPGALIDLLTDRKPKAGVDRESLNRFTVMIRSIGRHNRNLHRTTSRFV